MPEAPEVSYLTNILNNGWKNRKLNSVKIMRGRYFTHGPPPLYREFCKALPLKLLNVEKKGSKITKIDKSKIKSFFQYITFVIHVLQPISL